MIYFEIPSIYNSYPVPAWAKCGNSLEMYFLTGETTGQQVAPPTSRGRLQSGVHSQQVGAENARKVVT